MGLQNTSRSVLAIFLGGLTGLAIADVDDGHGRLWRMPADTTGVSWQQVLTVCPTDGLTPGSGVIGDHDFTGWIWATQAQVTELFSYSEPDILDDPSLRGPAYFAGALLFTETFGPTFKVHSETYSNQMVAGLTATVNDDDSIVAAGVNAQWPVFIGGWTTVGSAASDTPSPYIGVWLWRPSTAPGDVDGEGDVDLSDLATLLSHFGTLSGATAADGDTDGDGDVDLSDLSALLANFGI